MSLPGPFLVGLLPLDVLPPTPTTTTGSEVFPQASSGFAAYLLGGFVGLGVIVLVMILLSLPRGARGVSPRESTQPKRAGPGWQGNAGSRKPDHPTS